jgi:hypothetical protein
MFRNKIYSCIKVLYFITITINWIKNYYFDIVENVPSIPTKQTFFNGIAAFTRQRTSRRLPLKRKRLEDGDIPSSNLHVKTNNPMDIGYDGVYGEPPAAAAKLRSGIFLIILIS